MKQEQLSSNESSDDYDRIAIQEMFIQPDWRNPEPVDRYNLVVIGGWTRGIADGADGGQAWARR